MLSYAVQGGTFMSFIQKQTILATPPSDLTRASAFGLPIAHMAYRIGQNGRLLRTDTPISFAGGILVIDSEGFDGSGDPTSLCKDIIRECIARKFDGILCDFPPEITPFLSQTVSRLNTLTVQHNWNLYLPESYAAQSTKSMVLISSDISSGSLESLLHRVSDTYGPERIALVVQRMAKEFRLPAGGEQGKYLTRKELSELVQHFSPSVFFDNKLCTHYFTYMNRNAAYFVLYDDSGSLLRKLSLARSLGITRFVLTFPDVEDILTRLLSE